MAVDLRSLDFGHEKPFCVYMYRDPRRGKKLAPIYIGKGATLTRPDVHWQRTSHNTEINKLFAEFRNAGLVPLCEYVEFFDDEASALRSLMVRNDLPASCAGTDHAR